MTLDCSCDRLQMAESEARHMKLRAVEAEAKARELEKNDKGGLSKGMTALYTHAEGVVQAWCCPVWTAAEIAERNGVRFDAHHIMTLMHKCDTCKRGWSGGCE